MALERVSCFLRPETLGEARALLAADPSLKVIAGGTDVYPALGEAGARARLLDITRIAGLRGINAGPEGVRIGALATWAELSRAGLPAGYAALVEAAREIGSIQIQNVATIIGNICNASPAADGIVALMTLDAEVEILGASGTRRVPLESFVLGPRTVALERGELVLAVHLPPEPGRSAFVKLGARKYLVISIAMVAVAVEKAPDGTVARVAITVGACSPVARRQRRLEQALIGARAEAVAELVDEALLEGLSPIDDVRAPAWYRRAAVPELIRRALFRAMEDGP